MINRELIRLKLVQELYSYHQRGLHNPNVAEKELLLSLDKAYDLYNYLLLLMVEVSRMAVRMHEMRQSRSKRLADGEYWSSKFIDNRFILQLEANRQLRDYCEEHALSWADHEDFTRTLYNTIEESEYYRNYMATVDSTYEEDRELWRLIYRNLIVGNEELDHLLEDQSIYWNDDRHIVDTFVLKTINRFRADSPASQLIMPKYKSDSDRDFALKLLRHTLEGQEYYNGLIAASAKGWEFRRIAVMDRIILQLGLAEITSFPSIPVSVSINEYLEITKAYSTPRSGKYINGTLDAIARQLMDEGKLVKESQKD